MNYTAQKLVYELRRQGVKLEKRNTGKLFIDGELFPEQLVALKSLKPQILDILDSPVVYRFGENEFLFDDLETSLQIFSSGNESANRLILYLMKHGERQKEKITKFMMFNYPTIEAYKTDLRVADAILQMERCEISTAEFKCFCNDYIEAHSPNGQPFGEWMQEKDAPLYNIRIYQNSERIAEAIGNTIQTAITLAFWSAVNPETNHEILRA